MRILGIPSKKEIVRFKIDVSPSAKLPLSKIKGSADTRNALAKKYNLQYMNELDKLSPYESCTVSDFKQALNNTLGEDYIKFDVLPLESKDSCGTLVKKTKSTLKTTKNSEKTIYNINSKILGYDFYFPLYNNNSVITDKAITVHEARHFFDYICNPKTITIPTHELMNENQRLKNFHNVYNSFVKNSNSHRNMRGFKKDIRNKISKMSTEDAINVLQTVRHSMKSEINAYKDEYKYMKKHPIKNMLKIINNREILKVMKYNSKISFANKLLAEKLEEAKLLKKNIEK